MSEVFADSFYFIALLNPYDRHHAAAVEAARSLTARVVTTHWVLVEVADALSAPKVRRRAAHFLNDASSQRTTVIEDFDWYEKGKLLFAARPDKSWSLTDCISFGVMEARGIREALTGDHDFAQAGFVPLLAVREAE